MPTPHSLAKELSHVTGKDVRVCMRIVVYAHRIVVRQKRSPVFDAKRTARLLRTGLLHSRHRHHCSSSRPVTRPPRVQLLTNKT